ncbi:hypothetical protein CDD82_440 [Ophiocordyceps australis]|uniref:NACHT domain-containing protein n=1 Tax=Ophiocordyceps australis TaxID=1399860 RepID=A0A2C5ZVS3_9HYPO|nr:hypothetical protein CDD82_440 [Ophiocordyceps australis]
MRGAKLLERLRFRKSKDKGPGCPAHVHPGMQQSGTESNTLLGPTSSQTTMARPSEDLSKRPSPAPIDSDTPINELWHLAYEKLRVESEKLVKDYESNLGAVLSADLESTLNSREKMRDWMDAIVQSKMEEVNRDTWKLKFKSSEVQVRDLVKPVLGIVNRANGYITKAISTNPTASMAWAGVSLMLPLLLNPSEQGTSLADGLEYISYLISQSRIWEDLYARRYESKRPQGESSPLSHTAYKDALEKLYRQILKFQATVYCYCSHNSISRLSLDSIKWHEWKTMLSEIKKTEDALAAIRADWRDKIYDDECAAVEKRHQEAMDQLQIIGTDFSGLRKAVEDAQAEKKRDKFIDWLCHIDPSGMYNTARDKHEEGTGDWLLGSDEFGAWKQSSGSLLWLHGKAGSGKSILSSCAIKHLRDQYDSDPQTAVVYFFFSFTDTEKQKVDGMLASLLKQLYARRPDTPELVSNLREYKKKGERPDRETLSKALVSTMCGFSAVFVVIDALDECPTQGREREKLLGSLDEILNQRSDNLHLFYTSRPEEDIKRWLNETPSLDTIDLTADATGLDNDIERYIDSTLTGKNFSSWSEDIKTLAKKRLIEKADGMFQYVFLQLEALGQLATKWRVRTALDNLPKGLDATYNRILESVDEEFIGQVMNALKWLAFSMRDLDLEQLAEVFILQLEEDVIVDEEKRLFKPEEVLRYLSSLVVTWEERGWPIRVRLAHFSVKEYLTSKRSGPFSLEECDVHKHIAQSSLAYHLYRSTMSEYEAESLKLRYYAARYWPEHLEMVPRKSWPVAMELDALRALAVGSKSLDITLNVDEPDIPKSPWMPNPLSFTASQVYAGLTAMLCHRNEYLTQGDLDTALQEAAFGGSEDISRLLVDMGANVQSESAISYWTYWTKHIGGALQAAVLGGSAAVVELLLDKGADVNAQDSKVGSALQVAAFWGRLNIVKLLVARGARVDLSSEAGCALTSAWYYPKVLEFLLDSGVDVDMRGGSHGTALYKAAKHLQITNNSSNPVRDSIHLLLDRGANVNARGGKYHSPLQAACHNTFDVIDDVKRLLDMGADVNAQGGHFGTALQAACFRGHRDIVSLLLDRGADVNAQGGRYGTALQAACVKNRHEMARLLLDRGADVNSSGGKFGSPLQAAASTSYGMIDDQLQLLELLLENGAIVHQQGGKYGTALHAACARGMIDRVKLLLDHGADVHAEACKYGSVLQAACTFRRGCPNIDIVGLLLEKGADVHARGGRYGSAWHAAADTLNCHQGDWGPAIDVMRLLLDRGVDVNDTQSPHGTALQAFLSRDVYGFDMIMFLLRRGADPNIQAGQYGFPLQSVCVFPVDNNDDYYQISFRIQTEKLRFLLDNCAGLDVNAAGGRYGSALQAAAYTGNSDAVKMLLEKGAHANARGGKYGSALNAAVLRGAWDIAEMLLEAGAKPDCQLLQEPDDEWLARFGDDLGRGAVERYHKFWEKQKANPWPGSRRRSGLPFYYTDDVV